MDETGTVYVVTGCDPTTTNEYNESAEYLVGVFTTKEKAIEAASQVFNHEIQTGWDLDPGQTPFKMSENETEIVFDHDEITCSMYIIRWGRVNAIWKGLN